MAKLKAETNETKSTEEKVEKEEVKLTVESISSASSPLAQAIAELGTQTYGVDIDRKVFELQEELESYQEKYGKLREKAVKNNSEPAPELGPNMVTLSPRGVKELSELSRGYGSEVVELKSKTITIPFSSMQKHGSSLSSQIMRILKKSNIAEFK